MSVVQKLLMPWQVEQIAGQGHYWVGGPVVDAGAAVLLASPSALLSAYQFDGAGGPFGDVGAVEFVDVLRFRTNSLMVLDKPLTQRVDGTARSYASGFLAGDSLVPVWEPERTRVPVGTEVWRILRDGSQQVLAVFGGVARGWRGARGYLAPTDLVGPRARWQGTEFVADLSTDGQSVELVALGEVPRGFTGSRPGVSVRAVPVAECDAVFELRLTCTWRAVPCRILHVAGGEALMQLLADDAASVATTGATAAEPEVYEVMAPVAELEDRVGTTRDLPLPDRA